MDKQEIINGAIKQLEGMTIFESLDLKHWLADKLEEEIKCEDEECVEYKELFEKEAPYIIQRAIEEQFPKMLISLINHDDRKPEETATNIASIIQTMESNLPKGYTRKIYEELSKIFEERLLKENKYE